MRYCTALPFPVTPVSRLFSYCSQPARPSTPNSEKPLLYPVIEGAAHSPRRSRRQSCRPSAGGRNLNHMFQRCRRGPLGRGPLSLTATAILLREDRNRDSLLQFAKCGDWQLCRKTPFLRRGQSCPSPHFASVARFSEVSSLAARPSCAWSTPHATSLHPPCEKTFRLSPH